MPLDFMIEKRLPIKIEAEKNERNPIRDGPEKLHIDHGLAHRSPPLVAHSTVVRAVHSLCFAKRLDSKFRQRWNRRTGTVGKTRVTIARQIRICLPCHLSVAARRTHCSLNLSASFSLISACSKDGPFLFRGPNHRNLRRKLYLGTGKML